MDCEFTHASLAALTRSVCVPFVNVVLRRVLTKSCFSSFKCLYSDNSTLAS